MHRLLSVKHAGIIKMLAYLQIDGKDIKLVKNTHWKDGVIKIDNVVDQHR